MTVLTGRIKTRSECDSLIGEKMRALAKVRARIRKGGSTQHVVAGLKLEEHTLVEDIKKLNAHKNKLRK